MFANYHFPVKDANGRIIAAGVMAIDETEKHTQQTQITEAKEALERQSVLTEAILNSSYGYFFIHDSDYKLVMFNEAATELMRGRGKELTEGMSAFEIIPDERRELMKSYYDRALAGEQTEHEHTHELDSGSLHFNYYHFPVRDSHDAIIAAGVLVMDETEKHQQQASIKAANEELAATEEELRQNLEEMQAIREEVERQKTLIESIINSDSDSIFVFDHALNIIQFNKAARAAFEQTGIVLKEGMSILDLAEPSQRDRDRDFFSRALGGESFERETSYEFDEIKGYYQVKYYPVKNQQGQIIAAAVVTTNITERREQEEAIWKAQQEAIVAAQRAKLFFESSQDAISIMSTEGVTLECNPAFLQLVGAPDKAAVIRKSVLEVSAETQLGDRPAAEAMQAEIAKVFQGEAEFVNWFIKRLDNGQLIDVEIKPTPIELEGQQVLLLTLRDVTERNRQQAELKAAQEKALQEAQRAVNFFESNRDAILFSDTQGTMIDCNQAYIDLIGAANKEAVNGHNALIISPEYQPDGRTSAQAMSEEISKIMAGTTELIAWQIKRLDTGELRDIELKPTPSELDGQPVMQLVMRDITEQKRQQAEVQKAQEDVLQEAVKAQLFFEKSRDAIVIMHTDGPIVDCNSAYLTLTGVEDKDFLIGQTPLVVSAEIQSGDRPALQAMQEEIARVFSGEVDHVEWLIKRHDTGAIVHTEIIPTPLELDGQPVLHLVLRDVTERNRQQQDLVAAKTRLDRIANNASGMLYQYRLDPTTGKHGFSFASERSKALFGITPEALISVFDEKPGLDVHPDDAEGFAAAFGASAEKLELFDWTGRIRGAEGDWRYIHARSTPSLNPEDGFLYWDGYMTDVTKRLTLQKQNESLEQAMMQSAITIDFSQQANILQVSPAWSELTGYTPEEAEGQPHTLYVPEDEQQSGAFQALWEELSQGQHISRDVKRQTKYGDPIWLRAFYLPIFGADGKLERIRALCTDVTEQKGKEVRFEAVNQELKATEEELRQNLEEMTATQDQLQQAQQDLQARKEQLDSLLNASENVIVLIDRQRNIIDFNAAFKAMYAGSGVAVTAEMNILDLFTEAQRPTYDGYYARVLKGEAFSVEESYDMGEETLYFSIDYRPYLDGNGQVMGVIIAANNTTQMHKLEAELAACQQEKGAAPAKKTTARSRKR